MWVLSRLLQDLYETSVAIAADAARKLRHKAEQLRLAMAAMKSVELQMEPAGKIPDDSMDVTGLGGLFAQIDLMAPSRMVEAGQRLLASANARHSGGQLAHSRQGSTESLHPRPQPGSYGAAAGSASKHSSSGPKPAMARMRESQSAAALLVSTRKPLPSVAPGRDQPLRDNLLGPMDDGWGLRDL